MNAWPRSRRPGLRASVLIALWTATSAVWGAGVPLHDGLTAYWPLQEGVGSLAGDAAPFGAVADQGTLRGGPTWITGDGPLGTGLRFDGAAEHVLIPPSADLDLGTDAVTLSAWIRLETLPQQLAASFAGIYDSAPDSYVLYLDRGNEELRFKVTTASGAAARPGVPAALLDTSDWHHVMGVYGGAGRAEIYFDGLLIDVESAAGLIGPLRSGQTAAIGADAGVAVGSATGSARYFFPGDITDVAVWNRPLGLAEAQYLYDNGAGRAVGAANPTITPIIPPPPPYRPVLVEAHRGNSVVAPENTLAAIRAAAGIADLVEFDVRVSADGQLVLLHDATLDRTTNGSGSVAARPYLGDLDKLDAGSWFAPEFAGEPLPTLADAVETTLALEMTPLIERKAGSAATYYAELSRLGALDDVAVIAFDWDFLSDLRALSPTVRLGALGSGSLTAGVIANAAAAGADFLDWGDGSAINAATLSMVRAAGLELHVWTVNSLARMEELIQLGVDGITTDDAAGLRSLVGWPPSYPADFNGDGLVDGADLLVWERGWGAFADGGATRGDGDANADGYVDGADLLAWQRLHGASAAAEGAYAPMPEPGSAALGVVAAVLAAQRRRLHAPGRRSRS